jgi:hypothetical protein
MHFGGGGGYAYPSSGGAGGGIILMAARTVTVEAGGLVEAQGADGASFTTQSQRGGGGGGAGGTVAVFTDSFTNQGTVRAQGGKGGDGYSDYDGGAGGEGWILTNGSAEKFTIASLPSDIHILLDGTDITAQVGDPNNMGDPHWQAGGGWGNGIDAWSTGELDLSSLGTWSLGRHTLELREDGGVGGTLEMALYMIYSFTASYAPDNDTCTAPMLLGVDDGLEVVVGTTEDSMGRIKAIDDFKQATCGGDGGPDVVYKLTLTDWRQLTVDVASSFTPRVYLRKGDCNTGDLVACGGANLVTPDLKTDTYYLFVDGDGNQEKGNFTLSVTSIPPPPASNDTCAGATVLSLDANNKAEVYGVSLFSKDNYAPGCSQVGAKDLVYQVEVPAGFETLRAVVETADFSPAVYIANGSCGNIWVTCVPGKTANISWPNAGTYYIVVDGKTVNDAGEFTLKVELILPE